MLNSSSKKVAFSQRPTGFVIAVQDAPQAEPNMRRRWDMKEVQRRAFERGVAMEREKYSKTLQEMVQLIKVQSQELKTALATDREQIEGFAVRLSLQIAEKLTRTIVDAEQHDVVQMVRDLLSEIDGETKNAGLTLRLNPVDHTALLNASTNTEINIAEIETIPDDMTPVGSPRLTGGDTEYYSDMGERLEQIRAEMIEESLHASS